MDENHTRPMGRPNRQPGFNARPLWTGGVATALVAALVALVGVVVVRGVFGIPVLGPSEYGALGNVSTVYLCLFAALAALVATALMHALLLSTPRPTTFFGWIVALVTAVVAVQPFTTVAGLPTQIASAVINALIGLAIGTLIGGVAVSAARRG